MKTRGLTKSESKNGIRNKEAPDTCLTGPEEQSPSLHYKRKWKWKTHDQKSENCINNNNKEEPDTGLSGPDEQSISLHYKESENEKHLVWKSEN